VKVGDVYEGHIAERLELKKVVLRELLLCKCPVPGARQHRRKSGSRLEEFTP
jgi:hypothetical protein